MDMGQQAYNYQAVDEIAAVGLARVNQDSSNIKLKFDKHEEKLKHEIKDLTQEIQGLHEINQSLVNLLNASKYLTSVTPQSIDNVFHSRSVSLTTSDPSINPNNMVEVFAGYSTVMSKFSLQINRIASTDLLTGTVNFTDPDTIINTNQVNIYLCDQPLQIPSNSTLNQIVDAINDQLGPNLFAYLLTFSGQNTLYVGSDQEGQKITLTTIVDTLSMPFSDPTVPLNLSGNMVINGTQNVVTANMTLNDILNLINNISGYSASIQPINGNYILNVIYNNTPVSLTTIATELLITQLGLSESALTSDQLQASVSINGNTFLNPTNQILNILPNTSIQLKAANPAVTIFINIQQDVDQIMNAIQNFIQTYNIFLDSLSVLTTPKPLNFLDNQKKPAEDNACLHKNKEFMNVIKDFHQKISGLLGILMQSGIRRDLDSGKLNIADEAASQQQSLQNMLNTNVLEIEKRFGFVTISNPNYVSVTQYPLIINILMFIPITLQLMKDSTGNYSVNLYGTLPDQTQVYPITLPLGSPNINTNQDGSVQITGPLSTPYAGFVFTYTGPDLETPIENATTSQNVILNIRQGLADAFVRMIPTIILPSNLNVLKESNTSFSHILKTIHRKKEEKEKKLKELEQEKEKILKKQRDTLQSIIEQSERRRQKREVSKLYERERHRR